MANVYLKPGFSELWNWAGHLFQAGDDSTIVTRNAKNFTFELGPSNPFSGFKVVILGKGFVYDAGEATDGQMTSISVRDGSGTEVLKFTSLGAGTLASDFAQFWSDVFGYNVGDSRGPDGYLAWSHLLSGNDSIIGSDSGDYRNIPGVNSGNDTYNMGAGDDQVAGSAGRDSYFGGDGFDVLSFSNTNWAEGATATQGLVLNVQTGRLTDPWGDVDTFSGFERFVGSRFNDRMIGSDTERDRFEGLRGRDTFDGGAASYDGNGVRSDDRRDEVRYNHDYDYGGDRGIVARLETSFASGSIKGTIRDGFGQVDTVIDIERVVGTQFDDTLLGSRNNNRFTGGEGKDRYDGGDGFDALDFSWGFSGVAQHRIVVDLNRASGQIRDDGFGNLETAKNIESITATNFNDVLKGSNASDEFESLGGKDTMTGRGGSDNFVWNDESQLGKGDVVTDFDTTGADHDYLTFEVANFTGMTTTAVVVNGTAATSAVGTFIFNAANDILYWDEDGTGSAAKVAIVKLTGVASLSADHFDFWT